MKKANIAVIGLGNRGFGLLEAVMLQMPNVEVLGVCDFCEEKAMEAQRAVTKAKGNVPVCTTDYRDLLKIPEVDAVIVAGSWECHVDIAVSAMKAGKYVGLESGGAYSIEDCWRLVRMSEQTGSQCMLLENCCYGREELMLLNMVQQGILGDIVHCSGGYHHDLRESITNDTAYRQCIIRNYIGRNCDNYPTHELGPIAKILNINSGNRMLTLNSVASKAAGLNAYIEEHAPNHSLRNTNFQQGDIVTTIIRCAGGETITLTLDTTLPCPYGRGIQIRGTKGMYNENNNSFFVDGTHNGCEWSWSGQWGNAEKYHEQYDHPLWKQYIESGVQCCHNGMDWLVLDAFFKSVAEKTRTPIDVYDVAAWMSISALSEMSIACGGAPVEIPDFTNGKWLLKKNEA